MQHIFDDKHTNIVLWTRCVHFIPMDERIASGIIICEIGIE